MPTATLNFQRLTLTDPYTDSPIYFSLNDIDGISVTNYINGEPDASIFYFNISKHDWLEIKSFIDKQLSL